MALKFVKAPTKKKPKTNVSGDLPWLAGYAPGEFKPLTPNAPFFTARNLAGHLGCTVDDILGLVERGVGPKPIEDLPSIVCFHGDSVALWVAEGFPNKLVGCVRCKDLWKVRSWGNDRAMRVNVGGPEEIPKTWKWVTYPEGCIVES